jgi:hypothetical protein
MAKNVSGSFASKIHKSWVLLAWGVFSAVALTIVGVLVSHQGSLADIRNRASGTNCQENRVKKTCGNPSCIWNDNATPYGGCEPLAASLSEACQTNPNVKSYSAWSGCSPAAGISACATTKEVRTAKDCSGKQTIESRDCTVNQNTCNDERKAVNSKEKCTPGVGCWTNNFCVIKGEENSGYVCQGDGLFKSVQAAVTYKAPEKTRTTCEGQGNCWFGNYCLKQGFVGKEAGDSGRSYCCRAGKGLDQDLNGPPSGNACAAVKVEPTATPAPWIVVSPKPDLPSCSDSETGACRIKGQSCRTVAGLEECYGTYIPPEKVNDEPDTCKYIRSWGIPIPC